MMIAATTTIASRALVSDMSGVCSSGETRLMTSNPTNPARMKTYRLEMKSAGMMVPLHLFSFRLTESFATRTRLITARGLGTADRQRRQLEKLPHSGIHDFSAMRDQRLADDLILQVHLQLAIFHHVS